MAVICLAARLALRIHLRQYHFWISDAWLVVSTLMALGLLICDTMTYKMKAMDNFTMVNETLLKIRFATNYFFDVGIYFPKFSVIALYFHLVPRQNRRVKYCLYVITGITGASCLGTFFADTLWCGSDPSINWTGSGDVCSAFTSMYLMRMNWSLNFICEVIIFLFPWPLIYNLNLSTRGERFGLSLLFTLGIATLVASTGRFITMVQLSNNISIYIWAAAELTISIIVVSLTALGRFLRNIARFFSPSIIGSRDKSWNNPRGRGHPSHSYESRIRGGINRDSINDPSGSEVQLHQLESGKIYKAEKVSFTSERKAESDLGEKEGTATWT